MLAEGDNRHGFQKDVLSHQPVVLNQSHILVKSYLNWLSKPLLYKCREVLYELLTEAKREVSNL